MWPISSANNLPETPFTVAQVTADLRKDTEAALVDALPPELAGDLKAPGFSRRLGHAFSRQQEVRFDRTLVSSTIRISRVGEKSNAIRWRVVSEP